MLAPTPTGRRGRNAPSTRRAGSPNGPAACCAASGRCCSRTTIRGSSPGRLIWPIRSGSGPIPDPENRLVARGLEREWEQRLQDLAAAEADLAQRERRRPRGLGPAERALIDELSHDLDRVWGAPTTSDRDRKELLRTLVEEVRVD